ncbi:LysR family transcriptional regulator [Spiribacter halobius]|uniref:LysR family transcriptional regulator n=1 Tax=Sediminicurvatus halobius TaxID=2182432 RepID=A0A2U2N5X4_9GAMM|nr:LysR family transcriptional regulator [Spiribacter halobius]PWG64394.1 LysR family transcriptional regulator [Spiribacter halobius]UEX79258.1 LysR family transcriptional regulator [Spiribacter halobius]
MSVRAEAAVGGSLPLLEHDVLRSFVAIAETGSFTRAAERVFRSPSAVSMQIKRLEETLGRPVFVREPRQVRLTAEGEALLGYARRLLDLNEEAVAQFLSPPVGGTVRLGTPDDVGTRILPGVLARFARTHPAVQVNVGVSRSLELRARLEAGELDLALITAGNEGQDDSQGELVYSERLVWAGREGGVAVQRSPLPLALAERGCAWRGMALAALDHHDRPYRIAYTSEHCAGQEAAMLADIAIAPFPRSLVRAPLQVLGEEAELPPLGAYQILLLRSPRRSEAADVLADHVVERFQAFST